MGIESREIAGQKKEFYILKILDTEMKLMIPTDGAQRAGLRDVISKKEAKQVIEILKDPTVAVTAQPWNKRYREYTEMLSSGSAFEVAGEASASARFSPPRPIRGSVPASSRPMFERCL